MKGGSASDAKFIKFNPLPPIEGVNVIETPTFEVGVTTERTEDEVNFGFEGDDSFVVKMIPMIVRNKENVDFGKIRRLILSRSGESFDHEGKRGSVGAQDRVGQNSFSVHFNKEGRMTEPDKRIIWEIFQIAFNKRKRFLRFRLFCFGKKMNDIKPGWSKRSLLNMVQDF